MHKYEKYYATKSRRMTKRKIKWSPLFKPDVETQQIYSDDFIGEYIEQM